MISRLLALNSKSLSKTARANFGILDCYFFKLFTDAWISYTINIMYRTIDLGVYHPWPSVIRLECAEVVGGRLQESAIDKSDNGYEPFRSSAPVDFYSTWSTSSRSWETLRVKITSHGQIEFFEIDMLLLNANHLNIFAGNYVVKSIESCAYGWPLVARLAEWANVSTYCLANCCQISSFIATLSSCWQVEITLAKESKKKKKTLKY